MAGFTKVLLIVLGLLSLLGGVFGAIESWQSPLASDVAVNRFSARAEALVRAADLFGQGRLAEAEEVEAEARAANPLPTPFEIEASQFLAFAWLASGLVSWALLWGLAAIISELKLLRSLVAKDLALATSPGEPGGPAR